MHIYTEEKGSLAPAVRDVKIGGLGSFYVFFPQELKKNKAKGQRSRDSDEKSFSIEYELDT